MLLSLVVPCYNEEGNVEKFYSEVTSAFSQRDEQLEFVFVDDGSTDGTYKALSEIYAANPESNIQVISFSRNFGKEAAMYAGLKNAKGDAVCIIDADLQQRPEVVCEMLGEMANDDTVDCVCAYQDKRKESGFIKFLKGGFYKLISRISDIDFVNGASDFRLMKRNMVDAILSMTEYHRFSKGIFSWVGFTTKYIPYKAEERFSGDTKWGLRKLIKYGINGIIAFSTTPLRIATYTGFTTAFLATLYLIAVIIEKLVFGIDVKGYPTLVVLILFIGGVQLFFLGIIGEYIAKMYVQVKDRPIYIEKNHLKR